MLAAILSTQFALLCLVWWAVIRHVSMFMEKLNVLFFGFG